MKFLDFDFPKLKGFLEKLTEVLLLVVAVSLLLGVLFGPDTAFIGKKFAYLFFGIIFGLNAVIFIWFFLFAKFS